MAQQYFLDLRGVACPMNFVKAKLLMDKMTAGQDVTLLLDEGEPVESVSSSVSAEGHSILEQSQQPEGHYLLIIRKAA
jgi:TusA-related sulfurtransferase